MYDMPEVIASYRRLYDLIAFLGNIQDLLSIYGYLSLVLRLHKIRIKKQSEFI